MKNLSQHSTEEVLVKEQTDEVYSFDASFAQKRLWLIDQLLDDKSVYNIPTSIRVQGIIQLEVLERAFYHIINRHDTLRTTFREIDGEIVQIVRERLQWGLLIDDLIPLAESVRWEHANNLAEKEAETPFDLQEGPLFRIRLIRLSERDHLLLVNLHHIISDGWSTDVLMRELSQLYKAFVHQEKIELEELPIQYADFAHFQKEWLQGEAYELQLNYWKERLSGELPVLQLSTAAPHSQKRGNRGKTYEFTVSPTVSRAIKQFSQREETTNFMTLFAVYNVWLFRYANQTDLLVGIPVAGREWEEVEELIGFFINNLVIRSQIDKKVSFRNFLQSVKQNVIEAYSNQDVPFEKVVEVVQPDRDIQVSPIFQNMFSLRIQDTTFTLEGLETEVIQVERHSAKFDLLMEMMESEDGFTGTLEYSTDLFDEESIKKMVNHFLNLLEGITNNAEESVARLPMLTEEEVQQQVQQWNETDVAYPSISVQEGFEAWASQKPEKIALVYGEETVSYGELNRKANQLAHRLQSLGVGVDTLVGICLNSSPEMVVSMLAVQKAGGAYVPLDPSLPLDRRRYMVERAGLKGLVTKQFWAEELSVEDEVAIVCLDSEAGLLAAEPENNLQNEASSTNRMYVIFTSGSTGVPKGVNVFRRGFENLMQWYIGEFQMSETDSMLLITSPSFDMTQKSIYAPLMTGGQLVLLKTGLYDAAEITYEIEKNNITLLGCTPSAFYPLLDETVTTEYAPLSTLRHVFLGGEPILANRLVSWTTSSACHAEVVNTYGPTECTDITVFKRLPDMELLLDKPMPIGRPVPNNKTYILNSELGLVPEGTPGELCITGVQVGGGYIGEEKMTADKFLVNPYGDERTPYLYRTGDYAKYLPDGTIEYLGRIDHQVKIRGFQIELREIEVVLRMCDGVKDTVVLATETRPGDKRLVAYVVPVGNRWSGEDFSTRLRNELLDKLPNYMIPSVFIVLEDLPLSPNGKVDRKALPDPKMTGGQERLYTAPRSVLERKMTDIWMSVLDVKKIGIYDNFFECGGHSLLATQLISRLRSALDTEISLRALFDNPTIAGLASEVTFSDRTDQSELESGLKHSNNTILPLSREDKIPLSFSQKRLWFLDRLEPESVAYNIFSAIRIGGTLDKQAFQICLNQLVERHESLRTTFKDDDGPVQMISPTLHIPLSLIDFREIEGKKKDTEVESFILEETRRPFDLERGPLLHVSLLWLDETEYVLLVSMHHIISDGWSIELLIQELGELYSAHLQGKPANLPELTVQYADYAEWQNNKVSGENLERLTTYWSEQLGGELPILELPSDNPRPKRQTFRGSRKTVQIQNDTVQKLKELSRCEEVTLFMVFLSAFSVLLNRLSRQEDLIIGTPIAGRTRTETEPLIGCFVNTLALRINLSEKPTFVDLLKRMRKVCLEAYAHQDMPFEKLVEIIQPERSLSRNPIFDVMINLVNTPTKNAQWQGVTLSQMDVGDPQSKFALTLYIQDKQEGMELEFVYQKDLYSEKRIEELSSQYTSLLKQIVNHSGMAIDSYSLTTDGSKKILPNPKAKLDKPFYPSVPEMFRRVTLQNPKQEAINHRGEKKTYGELAEAVHSIASSLHAGGLNQGEVVAIFGRRSIGLIASMLGVLTAGGVVLTIDKNMQLERRKTILHSSGVDRLIFVGSRQTEDESLFTNTEWKKIHFINEMKGEPLTNLKDSKNKEVTTFPLLQTDDPAYIFFTSGTTGVPKGVVGKHSGLAHFLVWQRERFGIGPGDRAAQLTGLSFDVVLRDILLPLTSGATICLPDVEEDLSALQILPWMEREKVTYFHTVPSLAQSWLEIENVKLTHLRYVFFAGEPLSADLVKSWRSTFGDHTTIINLYGPTETTLAKCYFEVPREDKLPFVQPVGQPLPETQVLVMNTDFQLCGIGEPGEIVIRTPFRTLGYLQDYEKDKSPFIPNPFTDDPEDILYRTGDMGIYRPDGLLDIAGRLDDQIKIRGIRVELGEIQSIISSHPLVKEVVVITALTANGDKRLAAYFVPQNEKLEVVELRAYVKEKLPSFMIPGAFVKLEAIPLNANGKVDRRKLPDPTFSFNELLSVFSVSSISPTTELEEEIGEVWKELLGVSQVGIHDNFFDIGGHSLLILQAKTKLAKLLQRDIPLVAFFQYPTVSSLATHLSEDGEESSRFGKSKDRGSNRRNALQQRRRQKQSKK